MPGPSKLSEPISTDGHNNLTETGIMECKFCVMSDPTGFYPTWCNENGCKGFLHVVHELEGKVIVVMCELCKRSAKVRYH